MFYIYILKCKRYNKKGIFQNEIHYTGMTGKTGVGNRFKEHKNGIKSAWMQKHNIIPIAIAYVEELPAGSNYYAAIKREKQVKRWSKKKRAEILKEYSER